MPDAPLFVIGQRYRRRAPHERLGGQRQGGISTAHDHPIVMLFTGGSGEQYGYRDGVQPDGMFWYTGEEQVGDMQMARGNRAIRDHETNGPSLHLFEQLGSGWVRYVGDATYVGHHETSGPDRTGASRKVLVFELALGEREPSAVVPDVRLPPERPSAELRDRTLAQLRQAALEAAGSSATVAERRTISRRRSAAIKAYVRKRAADVCEACGEAATKVVAIREAV